MRESAIEELRGAISTDDPQKVSAIYQKWATVLTGPLSCDPGLKAAVEACRQAVLQQAFRQAIDSKNPDAIIEAGDAVQECGVILSDTEMEALGRARCACHARDTLVKAIDENNDLMVVAVSDEDVLQSMSLLTPEMGRRMNLARERLRRCSMVGLGIGLGDDPMIARHFNPEVLDGCQMLSEEQRQRGNRALARARTLQQVQRDVRRGRDDALEQPLPPDFLQDRMTAVERDWVDKGLASHRLRSQLEQALASGDIEVIASLYDEAVAAGVVLQNEDVYHDLDDAREVANMVAELSHLLGRSTPPEGEVLRIGLYLMKHCPHLLNPEQTCQIENIIVAAVQRRANHIRRTTSDNSPVIGSTDS
jgi:hypothetical protein